MLGQNILNVYEMFTLLLCDICSHNVEKMFLDLHSPNILMMLFVLHECSKKHFCNLQIIF